MLPHKKITKITDCNHIRIRDNNDYEINVEKYIQSIEKQFQIDFRSLSQWKELIQRLHVNVTDCKRRIQDANNRKVLIVNNLYIQSTRLSPFEMTENFVRTAKLWHRKRKEQGKQISVQQETETIYNDVSEFFGEVSELTGHPNTEIFDPSEEYVKTPCKITDSVTALSETPRLPAVICINPHTLLSPLGSDASVLSYKNSPIKDMKTIKCNDVEEWTTRHTSCVRYFPEQIIIDNNSSEEQIIKFSVTNVTADYMNIRFKYVTNKNPFRSGKILPVTPLKLYPGIPVFFKFIFKLFQSDEEFLSGLHFRVGKKVLAGSPTESLHIPILSKLKKKVAVSLSEAIYIPPAYSWHVNAKCGFPTGIISLTTNDQRTYHLYIRKRIIDLADDMESSSFSLQALDTNTQNIIQSRSNNPFSENFFHEELGLIKPEDVIALLLDDLVQLALDSFVFKQTHFYLLPYSKRKIPIYFTKAEHIGYHQNYYDFEFCDPITEECVITKTIKVFAEVLPNPIQVTPKILDMSNSPISHGFCEDRFVIENKHKLYPVTIKIKLTTKMKKLMFIRPTESVIPTTSSVEFEVKFCSREFKQVTKSDELVHLTIKIVASGNKTVYCNMPPIFYEIVAPCAFEFKKIYNRKYYNESPVFSNMHIEY